MEPTMIAMSHVRVDNTHPDGRELGGTRPPPGSRCTPSDAPTRTRVLIANDQPIVRHGLRALFENEPDIKVVGEAENCSLTLKLARLLRPDVVIVDMHLPQMDAISATRSIRAELPDTQVVVMAGVAGDVAAIESIRAGAVAYLL